MRKTNVKLTIPARKNLRKVEEITEIDTFNSAVSGEKSTVLLVKQFQILTSRSVKKEDLTVQAHWRRWPLIVVVDLSSKDRQSAYPHEQR